jgi:hypothetical protein
MRCGCYSLVVNYTGPDHKEITRFDIERGIADSVGRRAIQDEIDLVHRWVRVELSFYALGKSSDCDLRYPGKYSFAQQYLFRVAVSRWLNRATGEIDYHPEKYTS